MTDYRFLCEKVILPIIAEKMGFKPKFRLFIVPELFFDFLFNQNYPERNPKLSFGFTIKKKIIYVKEDPLQIAYGFIHELLHIYYLRKDGESYMRYEMRIRFLALAVFYRIMINEIGKKEALRLFDLIRDFLIIVPDYLKK